MNVIRPAAALLAALLILAACSGAATTPSASPERSETPSSTPTESEVSPPSSARPEPSPSPDSAATVLRVVADALRMRAEPDTDADAVGSLARHAVVRVESGPQDADGFTWYEVIDLSGQRGWVADGDAADAWLAPAAEEGDESVILSFSYGCDVVGPIRYPATTITEGGRVIVGYGQADGMTVGRLSASGMAHVQENVIGSRYLQADGSYEAVPLRGAEPPGHGACFYTFTLPTDGEAIVVTAVSWFGDEEEAEFWQPSPQRKALTEIASNLMVIDEILDDDAWEGPAAQPYVAAEYVLWVGAGEGVTPEGAGRVDPAALGIGTLEDYGEPVGSGRCAVVPVDDAFEVVRVLNASTDANDVGLDDVTFGSFEAEEGWYSVVMIPRTPDAMPGCDAIGF